VSPVDEQQDKFSDGQAKAVLDMLACLFRDNDSLLFTDYAHNEIMRKIATLVSETGRTVWNGT
jgi:hypothetical protein